jgi:hypothetical protein
MTNERLQAVIEVLQGAAYDGPPRHKQYHIMQALLGLMGRKKYDAFINAARTNGYHIDEGEL